MKNKLNIILIILTSIISFSCNKSKITEKEITEKAIQIIEILNKKNIDTFNKWNFEYRGKSEIWRKRKDNSNIYRAGYRKGKDTTRIHTFMRFSNTVFPCKIKIDTSIFKTSLIFKKYENEKIMVEATNKKGTDILIGKNLKPEDVFVDENPFIKLKLLSNLKDKLNVYRISSFQKVDGFIQFDLGNQYVLTYIPSALNPDYKEAWTKIFSKGKMILEKWNLRKLEKPRDNG